MSKEIIETIGRVSGEVNEGKYLPLGVRRLCPATLPRQAVHGRHMGMREHEPHPGATRIVQSMMVGDSDYISAIQVCAKCGQIYFDERRIKRQGEERND